MPKPAKNPSPEEEYRKKLISDIRPIARKEAEENPPDVNVEPEEDEEIEGEEEEEQEPQPNREDIERLARQQRVEKTPQEQLEKGEVPEYEAQPPEAYKQPPGGPAIEPAESRLTDKEIRDKELGSSEIDPKTGQPKRKYTGISKDLKAAHNRYLDLKEKFNLNALKERLKEQAKKLAWEAIKKAAAAAWKSIVAATAEYWGPILIGLIAVIIIIVGVVILIRALQTPNAMGSSPVQAADILDDHPLIKTVLALSNPAEFQKMLDENKSKLLSDIESFEAEIKSKFPDDSRTAPTITKLDAVKTLIATYTKPDAAQAKEIRDKLVAAVKPWSVTLNPGGFIFPVASIKSKPPLSSDWGPYNSKRPNHTGIDVGLDVGTIYRAPTDGEVVYVDDSSCRDGIDTGKGNRCNGGFGNVIVVKVTTDGQWKDYYWQIDHLKKSSAGEFGTVVGKTLKQGDIFARSGNNGSSTGGHIHFEVIKPGIFKGRPVGGGSKWPAGMAVERIKARTVDPFIALGWQR